MEIVKTEGRETSLDTCKNKVMIFSKILTTRSEIDLAAEISNKVLSDGGFPQFFYSHTIHCQEIPEKAAMVDESKESLSFYCSRNVTK